MTPEEAIDLIVEGDWDDRYVEEMDADSLSTLKELIQDELAGVTANMDQIEASIRDYSDL